MYVRNIQVYSLFDAQKLTLYNTIVLYVRLDTNSFHNKVFTFENKYQI